jgi:hypothetical protein
MIHYLAFLETKTPWNNHGAQIPLWTDFCQKKIRHAHLAFVLLHTKLRGNVPEPQ